MRRRALVASSATVLLLGCGASSGPGAEAPSAREAAATHAMAEAAASQGGLSSLTGSDADGVRNASSLKADLLADDEKVKLDGVLGEWPARTRADTQASGSADPHIGFSVGVRYDANNIYVGGEVQTTSFDRTSRFADDEEHASLVLAFGTGAASVAVYEIAFFAGKPGESAGQVRFLGAGRGAVPGAKIVEAPMQGGYSFEALVPWNAFAEARTIRVGLRAVARYTKRTQGGANIVATGAGDAQHPALLPPLPLEAEQSLDEGFLAARGLHGHAPTVDLLADVTGDGMKERVQVWGDTLTVCGPTYRGGKDYFYRDFGAPVVRLEARPLTGRKKDDLILVRRVSDGDVKRDWFEVLSFAGKDDPERVFGQEIAVVRRVADPPSTALTEHRVDNAVHAASGEIDVSILPAHGWDAATYHENMAADVPSVLLPWGTIKSQTFRFDGKVFAKVREVTQPGTEAAHPALVPRIPSDPATLRATVATLTPPAPSAAQSAILDQFKRDHGLPLETAIRSDLAADLNGDGKSERVALIERDLIVTGPSIGDGRGYTSLTLQQFATPADIHEIVARDLVGQGSAHLVVRGTRHVTPANAGDVVDEDALFVYALRNGTLVRVFGIETSRAQGANRVQGLVQFIPSRTGHGLDIDVRPGRTTGWTRATYPWPQERPGTGAMEPLLLPWGAIPKLRYAWDGTHFSAREGQ